MNTLIALLAIFGLQFLVTQSDGPFELINKGRNLLMRCGPLGPFFFKLFSCPFCSGCWSGLIIYIITQEPYKLNWAFVWGLAGGTVCLIIDALLSKLHQ